MGRPRKPDAVQEATGAFIKDPQRARKSPKVSALGPPPKRLTDIQREAWLELADEIPWLGRSDRKVVEVAAKLTARLMTDPDMGVNAIAQLRMCLTSLGATPADRSKVAASDDDETDPADAYFN